MFYNKKGTVAGYVTQEECLFSNEIYNKISSRRSFCAGEKGKSACRGDSGGGFYVKSTNKYTIFGIVSAAPFVDCVENVYVIFTNVPKFIVWIKNIMDKKIDDDEVTVQGRTASLEFLPPKLLWNLPKLVELWAYENPYEIIPRRFFKNNKEVVKLWMGYNKIKKIEVNFKALPKLDVLDLRENDCINLQTCISCGAENFNDIQEKIDRDCNQDAIQWGAFTGSLIFFNTLWNKTYL
ncbi:hypothetical protein PVAND_015409 [Polypedilum vanderplanki]|uniref:Peptidase S1 domain-containing protein n=1 Tax=Polypedilum vanderplanki TaxID=319348 RepID=A0A9J6BCI7_POLVA|nr:hypothetical protein PVAND_015409 [Polypedilum vanderplanki]